MGRKIGLCQMEESVQANVIYLLSSLPVLNQFGQARGEKQAFQTSELHISNSSVKAAVTVRRLCP